MSKITNIMFLLERLADIARRTIAFVKMFVDRDRVERRTNGLNKYIDATIQGGKLEPDSFLFKAPAIRYKANAETKSVAV